MVSIFKEWDNNGQNYLKNWSIYERFSLRNNYANVVKLKHVLIMTLCPKAIKLREGPKRLVKIAFVQN